VKESGQLADSEIGGGMILKGMSESCAMGFYAV